MPWALLSQNEGLIAMYREHAAVWVLDASRRLFEKITQQDICLQC